MAKQYSRAHDTIETLFRIEGDRLFKRMLAQKLRERRKRRVPRNKPPDRDDRMEIQRMGKRTHDWFHVRFKDVQKQKQKRLDRFIKELI